MCHMSDKHLTSTYPLEPSNGLFFISVHSMAFKQTHPINKTTYCYSFGNVQHQTSRDLSNLVNIFKFTYTVGNKNIFTIHTNIITSIERFLIIINKQDFMIQSFSQ